MSTTKPGAGRQWPADAADLGKPDDHGGGGGVDPGALKRGHEQDVFAVKPILSIPIAVVVTFVIAFATAWGVFAYYMHRPQPPVANPLAEKRNNVPLDARIGRIDRTGREPGEKNVVDNARLEPIRMLDHEGKTTTRLPLAGNQPEYHPEDIVPSPEKWPQLYRSGTENGVTRVPLDKAMQELGSDKGLRDKLLPTRKNPVPANGGAQASSSSAGRAPVVAEKHDDHDGHDHKKDKK